MRSAQLLFKKAIRKGKTIRYLYLHFASLSDIFLIETNQKTNSFSSITIAIKASKEAFLLFGIIFALSGKFMNIKSIDFPCERW